MSMLLCVHHHGGIDVAVQIIRQLNECNNFDWSSGANCGKSSCHLPDHVRHNTLCMLRQELLFVRQAEHCQSQSRLEHVHPRYEYISFGLMKLVLAAFRVKAEAAFLASQGYYMAFDTL